MLSETLLDNDSARLLELEKSKSKLMELNKSLEQWQKRIPQLQDEYSQRILKAKKYGTNIYYLCPDTNNRHGGIKQIYRHAEVLKRNGFSAAVLHRLKDFKCDWFKTDAQVVYESDITVNSSDCMVIPEVYGPEIKTLYPGVKKIIFNQNAYFTFWGYPLLEKIESPYFNQDVIAVLAISDDNKNYLNHAFPHQKVYRVRYGFDTSIFSYSKQNKKRKIAFMTNKNIEDVRQVINILQYRDALKDYELVPIENKTEAEVASIMKESIIFLWFGHFEGWPLPPAEAMASGCMVIGYQNHVIPEQMMPEWSYPIIRGEPITLAKTAEAVINLHRNNPEILEEKAEKAVSFIREGFSLEREQQDIIDFWNEILVTL